MATKSEVLQYIQTLAEQGITQEEIDHAYRLGEKNQAKSLSSPPQTVSTLNRPLSVIEIIYVVGILAVIFGAYSLLISNWETVGFLARLAATLGMGITTFLSGMVLIRRPQSETAALFLTVFSAIMIPLGMWVLFLEIQPDISGLEIQRIISGTMLLVTLAAYLLQRKPIFSFMSILFGTWLYFVLTQPVFDQFSDYSEVATRAYAYRAMIPSLLYLALAFGFARKDRQPLQGVLYGFGTLGLLGSVFALGNFDSWTGSIWVVLYAMLLAGMYFFASLVKSKNMVFWTCVFLFMFIARTASEFLTNQDNWSLLWLLSGIVIIGIAFVSARINRQLQNTKLEPLWHVRTPAFFRGPKNFLDRLETHASKKEDIR